MIKFLLGGIFSSKGGINRNGPSTVRPSHPPKPQHYPSVVPPPVPQKVVKVVIEKICPYCGRKP